MNGPVTTTAPTPDAYRVPGAAAVVVGDGTTARSRAGGRWRRWRLPLAIAVVVVVAALVSLLPAPRTSLVPLAPDNARPDGARAAAQILRREGVEIDYVRRIADVEEAVRAESTVVVMGDGALDDEQVERLDALDADLVLVAAPWAAGRIADVEETWSGTSGQGELRWATCDDPDAVAARRIAAWGSLVGPPGSVVCFPAADGAQGSGAYVVVEQGDRRVTVLADAAPVTNEALDEQGHAALTLRMLGRTPHLVWYVPSWDDDAGPADDDESPGSTMPPWTGPLALQLLVVAAVAALWRGRRFGRLVAEPLPVVVRAGETTRGRGRLYRRARAHGHAAAALRAGAATRVAHRLGLQRSAPAEQLIDAVARATGRPADEVAALLYGPPPTDDAGLARLARDLDHLESEVHRT